MAEGNKTTGTTAELHHPGQDDNNEDRRIIASENSALGAEDATAGFEDRLKRKMAEGNKPTAATTALLHCSGQDGFEDNNEDRRIINSESTDGPSLYVSNSVHHNIGGAEDATASFENRLKRKMAEGYKTATAAAAAELHKFHENNEDERMINSESTEGPSLRVSNSVDERHLDSDSAFDAEDATARFEDRLKRKMADGNKATAATAADLHYSIQDGSDGDIEHERIINSENTDGPSLSPSSAVAATGGTLTHTTMRPLGGLELANVENAAHVPLVQQITGRGIEKDDVASKSEDASASWQPLKTAKFEEEAKSNSEKSGEDSKDDSRSLVLSLENDSHTDIKANMAASSQISAYFNRSEAAAAEAIGGNSDGQQIDKHEHESVGDEENLRHRFVGSDEDRHSTSDDENSNQGQILKARADRNPSLPILEAYLVEEERIDDGPAIVSGSVVVADALNHDAVYEATPLEELPWLKHRRIRALLVTFCVLIIAMAVGLGYSLRPAANSTSPSATQSDDSESSSDSSDTESSSSSDESSNLSHLE